MPKRTLNYWNPNNSVWQSVNNTILSLTDWPSCTWCTWWRTCPRSTWRSRCRAPWGWTTWCRWGSCTCSTRSTSRATAASCTPSSSCLHRKQEEKVQLIHSHVITIWRSGKATCSSHKVGNCFPRVPLINQPCCLASYCQGMLGKLTKNSLPTLLYSSFCLFVIHQNSPSTPYAFTVLCMTISLPPKWSREERTWTSLEVDSILSLSILIDDDGLNRLSVSVWQRRQECVSCLFSFSVWAPCLTGWMTRV